MQTILKFIATFFAIKEDGDDDVKSVHTIYISSAIIFITVFDDR